MLSPYSSNTHLSLPLFVFAVSPYSSNIHVSLSLCLSLFVMCLFIAATSIFPCLCLCLLCLFIAAAFMCLCLCLCLRLLCLLCAAIDEADRLLDLGFLSTIKAIVSSLPSTRQTLLFSATLNSAVQRLGLLLCSSKPEAICTDTPQQQQQQQLLLKQTYVVIHLKHKTSALFSILRAQCKKKILVFVSSCKQAKFIHEAFKLLKPGQS